MSGKTRLKVLVEPSIQKSKKVAFQQCSAMFSYIFHLNVFFIVNNADTHCLVVGGDAGDEVSEIKKARYVGLISKQE